MQEQIERQKHDVECTVQKSATQQLEAAAERVRQSKKQRQTELKQRSAEKQRAQAKATQRRAELAKQEEDTAQRAMLQREAKREAGRQKVAEKAKIRQSFIAERNKKRETKIMQSKATVGFEQAQRECEIRESLALQHGAAEQRQQDVKRQTLQQLQQRATRNTSAQAEAAKRRADMIETQQLEVEHAHLRLQQDREKRIKQVQDAKIRRQTTALSPQKPEQPPPSKPSPRLSLRSPVLH